MATQADKAAAYATLYEALVTFSQVLAPILPFVSEALWQDLVVAPGAEGADSVHLSDFPEADPSKIDADLEAAIAEVRRVVTMGRALRATHQLKTRQPLSKVTVVHHDPDVRAALQAHGDLVLDELNVKELALRAEADDLVSMSFKPNFPRLGKRLGKRMREAAGAIAQLTSEQWRTLRDGGSLVIADEPITAEDLDVRVEPKGDVVLEADGALTVALDPTLTDALVREGLGRELVSQLNKLRKDTGLEVTDRIDVVLATDDAELQAAIDGETWMADEVLASSLGRGDADGGEVLDVDGRPCTVRLSKV